jgi:ABC-type cobalamin transport system permease subunit
VDPFKNFLLNLNAPGRAPITVLIGWMFGIVALGIFGHGELACYALGLMAIVGGIILATLALRT